MKLIYTALLILCFNLAIAQNLFNGKKINTNPLNNEYKNSQKFFYGELNPKDYADFKLLLEKELETEIVQEKSIFINFEQAASNCSLLMGSKSYLRQYHNSVIRISNRISKENNAVDFFIYDSNSFLKIYTEENTNYKVDKGYFANEIFTLKENCEAFFILKPNGKYMICYGTDSFSYALNFLEQK